MTEMVTSGSMSGERKRSDGPLGESSHERRRSRSAPPVLHATAPFLDSTTTRVFHLRRRPQRRPDSYSALRASFGSTPAALRAGPYVAHAAAPASTHTALAIVAGPVGVTANSSDEIKRPAASAPASPAPRPPPATP